MKKYYSLLLSFLFILISIYSFGQPAPSWVSRYNGPANRDDKARILQVVNGNVYVTGASSNANRNWDITTVMYNSSGLQQWVSRFNGSGNGDDYPFGMTIDGAGNVYVTGRSKNSANYDIITIKYLANGTEAWKRTENGTTNLNDFGRDVKVDATGNVYVAAVTDGANDFNGNKISLIKYLSNGDREWQVSYDNVPDLYDGSAINKEEVNSLVLDGAGNIYLAGYSQGFLTVKYDNNGALVWENNLGGQDAREIRLDFEGNIVVAGWGGRVAKYEPAGSLLWDRVYTTNTAYNDVEADGLGNIYLTGYTRTGSNSDDIFTAKYSPDGTFLWGMTYGGSAAQTDEGRAIVFDADGNFFVTGNAIYKSGRSSVSNYVTIKYNSTGGQQWVAQYDGADKLGSSAFDMGIDANGNLYVTGESATKRNSYDYVTLMYGKSSLKLDRSNNVIPANVNLRNYPNPFADLTTIEYQLPEKGEVKLSVFDLTGRELSILANGEQAPGSHRVNFNSHSLPAGTYLYRLEYRGNAITKQMIVTR